jgi:hypothetical protein
VLSHTVFLDWNYEEATQAVCKWLLQSETLFEWLEGKVEQIDHIDLEDLTKMRQSSEYELPVKIAENIVEMIFQRTNIRWPVFFGRFKHRENTVLPGDIMLALKILLQNKLPLNPDSILAMSDFREIGDHKKEWLKRNNSDLLNLIIAYNNKFSKRFISREKNFTEILHQTYQQLSENEKNFSETLNEGIHMGIFNFEYEKEISMAPVYRLIRLDEKMSMDMEST